mmetsp:Transcript_6203/g.9017  ORF Transcript_6203/g.9017 Transcript_6203/m.9017 type:complete len:1331 (+) Transcript_6203:3-3995(+)
MEDTTTGSALSTSTLDQRRLKIAPSIGGTHRLTDPRSGSLLALGCMQRSAKITSKHTARARARFGGMKTHSPPSSSILLSPNSNSASNTRPAISTPTMIMITRVLPYISLHPTEAESFLTRTYALHSFSLLLSCSGVLDVKDIAFQSDLDIEALTSSFSSSTSNNSSKKSHQIVSNAAAERHHILLKAIEIVENNFFAAWTTTTLDTDSKTQDGEKFAYEQSFLSILIRLMTFLLRPLKQSFLNEMTANVSNRFFSMVLSILQKSNHSYVKMEGFIFLKNFALLYPDNIIKKNNAKSITLIYSVLMESLLQNHPRRVCSSQKVTSDIWASSLATVKLTVECIHHFIITKHGFFPDQSLAFRRHLLGLLEATSATKSFMHTTIHRNILAPRGQSISEVDLEKEIVSCLSSILCNEDENMEDADALQGVIPTQQDSAVENQHDTTKGCAYFLNWILLLRSIIAGDLDNDSTGEEVQDPKARVDSTINIEAMHVLNYGNGSALRWQVKFHATKLACLAMNKMKRQIIIESGCNFVDSSPHMNVVLARDFISKQISHEVNQSFGSYLVLHLGDIISTASSGSISTLDQTELVSFQIMSLHFLNGLVKQFSQVIDPDEIGSSRTDDSQELLAQFSSQIIPSIKHAVGCLSSIDDDCITSGEGYDILFMLGCEGIQQLIEAGLVADVNSFQRIIRPLIPSEEEIQFCPYTSHEDRNDAENESYPIFSFRLSSFVRNRRSALLVRMSMLATIADINLSSKLELIPRFFAHATKKLIRHMDIAVAANCAAFAVDACMLLMDKAVPVSKESVEESHLKRCYYYGLTFSNVDDIDGIVKDSIIKKLPVFAAFSFLTLYDALNHGNSIEGDKQIALLGWLRKISPIILNCFYVNLQCIANCQEDNTSQTNLKSVEIYPPEKTCAICLHIFSHSLSQTDDAYYMFQAENLVEVASSLSKTILIPILDMQGQNNLESKSKCFSTSIYTDVLLNEADKFMNSICKSKNVGEIKDRLLNMLLPPLKLVEYGDVICDEINMNTKSIVIATHLKAVYILLSGSHLDDSSTRAIFHLAFDVISKDKERYNNKVHEVGYEILRFCSERSKIDISELESYCVKAAQFQNWSAWTILFSILNNLSVVAASLPFMKEALIDFDDVNIVHSVLVAIRGLICKKEFLPFAMKEIGGEVIQTLKLQGSFQIKTHISKEDRILVCTESVKILAFSLQYLFTLIGDSNNADDDAKVELIEFLSIIFGVMVQIITYNGLPNQNLNSEKNADTNIGRICAQLFVLVAKSSPSFFKFSMSKLKDRDRALVELSVRADMSGYALPKRAMPVKKKISLKGFK